MAFLERIGLLEAQIKLPQETLQRERSPRIQKCPPVSGTDRPDRGLIFGGISMKITGQPLRRLRPGAGGLLACLRCGG